MEEGWDGLGRARAAVFVIERTRSGPSRSDGGTCAFVPADRAVVEGGFEHANGWTGWTG
ncbi:hypothetical protein [Kitasatospora sp. NPDC088783]|uniref:hypothetical protein n=1 Tax=Kitasatospora sp. NPDC088783 TaxID=3364077 RepID=UPI003830DDDD